MNLIGKRDNTNVFTRRNRRMDGERIRSVN